MDNGLERLGVWGGGSYRNTQHQLKGHAGCDLGYGILGTHSFNPYLDVRDEEALCRVSVYETGRDS